VYPPDKPRAVRLDPALLHKPFSAYTPEEVALWQTPDVEGQLEAVRLRLALLASVHNAASAGAGRLSTPIGRDAEQMLFTLAVDAWGAVHGLCEALPADVQRLRIVGSAEQPG
jgi:hypothetical protein